MTNSILTMWTPEPIEIVIVLCVFSAPIVIVVWLLKLFSKSKNENIRLRLEVGKLADELEQIRKGTKSNNDNESKEESD